MSTFVGNHRPFAMVYPSWNRLLVFTFGYMIHRCTIVMDRTRRKASKPMSTWAVQTTPIRWDAISCLSMPPILSIVVATILEKLVVLTVFKGPPHVILLIFQSALRPARKPYVHWRIGLDKTTGCDMDTSTIFRYWIHMILVVKHIFL